jgi:TrmH family RNA methyltransferase
LAEQARLRRSEGRFVIEGPLLVAEALEAGLALEVVFVEERRAGEAAALVADAAEVVVVADGALDRVGAVGTSQGVLAVAAVPAGGGDLPPGPAGLVLVAHEVADPGNLGTLLRSAEAAGAARVVVTGNGVDVWAPKVVRAAAGSLFRLTMATPPSVEAALGDLRAAGVATWAAVARGGHPHDRVDWAGGPVALVVGSEAHGLPVPVVAACDGATTIELAGKAESLNVAMAGTVLLFEALRQRRASAGPGAAPGGGPMDWTSMPDQARVSLR